ncbi:type II toxin-antitoxin system RelE/ParE family toxin [Hymenobacter nivis]|uniref:type II toxin-antitoxin system RelE/ParE family toxin n=1 Tax=Hymenobacter nivis TaxID=1850093 RepID=UPI0013A5BA3A
MQRIIDRTRILESFPRLGRMVPKFGNPRIRELTEGNFRIVYRIVSTERIDITRVHHTSRPLSDPG